MDRPKDNQENIRLFNTDWVQSLNNIVEKTESNLKGISSKDDHAHHHYTPMIPCCDDDLARSRVNDDQDRLLAKMKYSRRMENEKFHQEIIANFNAIDQKLLLDAQRSKRDNLALKGEIDELRMMLASHGETELELGEVQKDIDIFNTQNSRRILELETKHMKSMASMGEDINERMNALQDQISVLSKDFTRPKPSSKPNKAVEAALEEALDRIAYLEERIDGIKHPRKSSDNPLSLKAIKDELLQNLDEKNDMIEESKQGLEKRLKHMERRFNSENQEQRQAILDLRSDLEIIAGNKDQLHGSKDIEKKMKLLDQRRRKESQVIQDDLLDIIDQKFIVSQKEKNSKLDRIIRELTDLNRRVDIHEDDMSEITKVIQELDKDRIQDGKTSDALKQKYELLDERIENLSEALIEVNNILNRTSKIQIDHNDLNIIKEACLQDFNTLNERINDVAESIDTITTHVDRNEKEIEAMKLVKQPRVSMIRKDISSPLRSSMSQHLGSNLHKRRVESQENSSRYENIQRLTDQDTFMKMEPRHIHERESVLSGSKINKYLGESFDDGHGSSYQNHPDRVTAFRERSRDGSNEKEIKTNFQSLQRQIMRSPREEQVIVEDVDSYDEKSDDKYVFSSQKKPLSSKQSELTFKADEIFNDRSEKNSNRKKPSETKVTSLERIKEERTSSISKVIDLTDKKSDNNIWGARRPQTNPNMLINENKSSQRTLIVADQPREPENRVQLGPIGGDTLDEESSEGEEFDSDLSVEENEYFKGHIVQKHSDLKKPDPKKAKDNLKDFDADWDFEN
ncbi:unnamed protein product [Moneuplotes crassus]|uniref:Uncharacterized protein n=2 Tax=Euplotes crassus TaxID=5936 RepID=A0AAD1Y536_EUPCR|nr:unnamed protein product [Moneuplotes crassus]